MAHVQGIVCRIRKEDRHGSPTDSERWPVLAGSDSHHRGDGIRTESHRDQAVYVLITAVDRVVEHLDTISKQINMTPQEKGAEP